MVGAMNEGAVAEQSGPELREPAHLVSPRARPYWRLTAAIGWVVLLVALVVPWRLWLDDRWWATAVVVGVAGYAVLHVIVMPVVRYRVHRWEVTPTAIFTRSGWVNREQRIAPLSRVQTVDSTQSGLMRLFDLASITVTTASAAGPITISCLDRATAERVVAELTEITGRTEGDAT